jgi:hypothetical protein
MKTISTLIMVMAAITLSAQSNLEGTWFTEKGHTSETLKFKKDGEVIIHQVDENDESMITEGHYYYEAGSDLLVIIKWHGDQASTLKYRFNADDNRLELNQFYPALENQLFDKGPSLADL